MIELSISVNRGSYQLEAALTGEERVTGLFGPSGSGKTTILEALAGILTPDRGRIAVSGEVFFDRSRGVNLGPELRRLGVVFQDNLLFPHLSVLDNLLFGFRRVSAGQRRLEPGEIFDLLDLGSLLGQRTDQISGGEERRVAIGRALLCSPRMLLLDEPLSGLDRILQDRVLAYLLRLKKELDIPMIYVSHSFADIAVLADSVAVLELERAEPGKRRARVAVTGTPQEIMAEVEQSGGLETLETVIPGKVISADPGLGYAKVQAEGLVLRVPVNNFREGDMVYVTVQADDIILSVGEPSRLSTRNQWPGTVKALHRLERTTFVTVDVGLPLTVELTAEAVQELGLKPGAKVLALVKAKSLRAVALEIG